MLYRRIQFLRFGGAKPPISGGSRLEGPRAVMRFKGFLAFAASHGTCWEPSLPRPVLISAYALKRSWYLDRADLVGPWWPQRRHACLSYTLWALFCTAGTVKLPDISRFCARLCCWSPWCCGAVAAVCRPCSKSSISQPAERTTANPPHAVAAAYSWDRHRRTDGHRPLQRPCRILCEPCNKSDETRRHFIIIILFAQ